MIFSDPSDPSTFILKQPFTRAAGPFDYVIKAFGFVLFNLDLRGNFIDNSFCKVQTKLIET